MNLLRRLWELREAFDAGDDDRIVEAWLTLNDELDKETEACLEWVRSREGAGQTPLGEADARPPQPLEAA